MAEIEKLEIKITADASQAESELKRLARAFKSFNSSGMGKSLSSVGKSVKSMTADMQSGVKDLGTTSVKASEAIANVGEAMTQAAGGAKDLGQTSVAASEAVEKAGESVKDYGKTTSTAETQVSRLIQTTNRIKDGMTTTSKVITTTTKSVQELNGVKTTEITKTIETMGQNFGRLQGTLGKVLGHLGKFAITGVKAIGSFAGGVAKHIGQRVVGSFTGFIGKLSHAFAAVKRIAFYRLIRSAIKGITTALKEGVSALIEWDRTWGNNTSYAAKTADEIKAKWTEVKKSFGAAAMPLIQILQPALMTVMQTAINVANAINQVLRLFQGYTTYIKATVGTVGAEADNATGKVKELQRVLFGFDDLNVLPSPNNGSGGGAAGGGGQYDFYETDIELPFNFEDSERSLGKQLADLINGAVDNFDAETLGTKIAGKINIAISNVKDLIVETNFTDIGTKIGEFLSSAITGIDWDGLGTIIGEWVVAIPSLIIGFIGGLDFQSVGTAIHDFVISALGSITTFFNDTDWEQLGQDLVNKLVDFIKGLNPIDVAISLWDFIKSVLTAAWGLIKGVGSGVADWLFGTDPITTRTYTTIFGETIEVPIETEVDAKSENKTENQYSGFIQSLQDESKVEVKTGVDKKSTKKTTSDLGKFAKGFFTGAGAFVRNNPYSILYEGYDENIARNKLLEAYQEKYGETKKWADEHPFEVPVKDPKINETPLKKGINDGNFWLKLHPLQPKTNDPSVNTSEIFKQITTAKSELNLDRNILIPKTKNPTISTDEIKKTVDDTKTWLNRSDKKLVPKTENPAIKTSPMLKVVNDTITWLDRSDKKLVPKTENPTIDTSGITSTLSSTQTELNKTPLDIKVDLITKGIGAALQAAVRSLQNALNEGGSLSIPIATASTIKGTDKIKITEKLPAYMYAAGGTPDVGTLFYAGEAGAEVVANMQGGTGVMNVSQMQEAVASGNVEVVNAIYGMANMIVHAVNNKDFDVYMDAAKVGQSVSNYQTNQARRGLSGAY